MPELTTDLGEMSELTMVLRSLSLSEEDGGPVQAVGLGEGVSTACWVPPSLPPEPEEAGVPEADEPEEPPFAPPVSPDPQPPTVAQTTPPSTAMTTTTAMSAKSRRRR